MKFVALLALLAIATSSRADATPPDLYSHKVMGDCSTYAKGESKAQGSTPVVRIGTSDWIEVGKPVTVCVEGLSEVENLSPGGLDLKSMRLFLAGHMLPLEPSLVAPPSQSYVNFQLEFPDNEVDRKTWAYIIAESRSSRNHKIPISVGFVSKGQPLESESYTQLHLYPRMQTLIFVPVLLVTLLGLLYCASRTSLIRDTSFRQEPAAGMLPYSLGRVQMAWWFFLVITTYIYLWVITRTVPPISLQVLGLLGISAGTGLGAAFIDQSKISAKSAPRNALLTEQNALLLRIEELKTLAPQPGTPPADELHAKQSRLAEVIAGLASMPGLTAPTSLGLFPDLLREDGVVSFHRFQIVGWTVVIGLIFVVTAYSSLVMPTFDSTLLVLMGISSGTYLGFKVPSS